ncbi:protein-tyrosine phosphatase [Ruminococcus sp. YE71]|uniref:tyrosine-protein phosphatase n=1 Tax=unclassified Ruminococcus TaxID=2608920 RepID=UPI00088DA332|nr:MULTISPECIES: CpsB/CapC family capsule biosynthesis tyrosine phosphatase [unclassified Ruminococcus]SDA27739.1 protein-tyrosine phosphatase [Ruminococcus sp. YE78]SFW46036.1 protein-tyrosine phosphatase [Ruminococcus sp. YE71]
MTDIHAHLLPGIDDGAQNMKDTLDLLRDSSESGVTRIVATPHFNPYYGWNNFRTPELTQLFESVRQAASAENIDIDIVLGTEINVDDDSARLLAEGKLCTYGNSRYVLAEFDERDTGRWVTSRLEDLVSAGYIPVVAHPERYYFVTDEPWIVYDWLEAGCLIQLTKGSILGSFGQEAQDNSDYLLDEGWVTCIASDGHRSGGIRNSKMKKIKEYIADVYSEKMARLLLEDNPAAIALGKEIVERGVRA